MKLYMEPEKFTWGVPMPLRDRAGRTRYTMVGEAYSMGKRLHVQDKAGREAICVRQRVPSLLPQYELEVYGRPVGTLVRDFGCLRPRYTVEELEWEVGGMLGRFTYEISWRGALVAASKAEPQGESFSLEIYDRTSELTALAVLLAGSCIFASQEAR